jgi:hypothetical protein
MRPLKTLAWAAAHPVTSALAGSRATVGANGFANGLAKGFANGFANGVANG